jgi:hypothetical protein
MSIFRRFVVRGMSSEGCMLNFGPLRSISFARKTLNTIDIITSADILVENGSISTLESVLLAILMAEVVNLKIGIMENFPMKQTKFYHLAACLNIGIMSPRVGLAAAVKACVSLGHRDREGLN